MLVHADRCLCAWTCTLCLAGMCAVGRSIVIPVDDLIVLVIQQALAALCEISCIHCDVVDIVIGYESSVYGVAGQRIEEHLNFSCLAFPVAKFVSAN